MNKMFDMNNDHEYVNTCLQQHRRYYLLVLGFGKFRKFWIVLSIFLRDDLSKKRAKNGTLSQIFFVQKKRHIFEEGGAKY